MIRNAELKEFEIKDWISESKYEAEAMTWIWNQLMGETAKGDTLRFVKIYRGDEKLYAGVLKGTDGQIKAIIPTMYERYRNSILDSIDYSGRTEHCDGEDPDSEFEIGHREVDIDALALKFLSAEQIIIPQ